MASPFDKLGRLFFAIEYQVVGLWNEILRRKYPVGIDNGQYLIFPEAYPHPSDRSGLMTDLSVNRLIASTKPGYPWEIAISSLALEGKGTVGDDWPAIYKQLKDWFDSAASKGQPFNSWSIAAKGPDARLYKYISATKTLTLLVVAQNGNQYSLQNSPVGGEEQATYDIMLADHWTKVDAALTYMAAHVPN